jgi:hypothetical protein
MIRYDITTPKKTHTLPTIEDECTSHFCPMQNCSTATPTSYSLCVCTYGTLDASHNKGKLIVLVHKLLRSYQTYSCRRE